MIAGQKYQPPKVIFVDVDGTLHTRGEPNTRLIEWIRQKKAAGFTLVLWSARGEEHAKRYAELFQVTALFHAIISKPGYIVDDQGWKWTRFTRNVRLQSDTDLAAEVAGDAPP